MGALHGSAPSTGIFRTAESAALCALPHSALRCSERTRYHLLNVFEILPRYLSSAKSRKVTCGQQPVWKMFAKMAEKYLHLACGNSAEGYNSSWSFLQLVGVDLAGLAGLQAAPGWACFARCRPPTIYGRTAGKI